MATAGAVIFELKLAVDIILPPRMANIDVDAVTTTEGDVVHEVDRRSHSRRRSRRASA